MEAPKPNNEVERLNALREFDILDTPPEEAFDRITRLAASIVGTPIVLVSLIDDDRQWFKSAIGLGASETPREVAFCAHAILSKEVMIVADTTKDVRFAQNPLVMGAPDIRFYAGAPLILSDNIRLGTLCAIDTEPRQLNAAQTEALKDLAAIVVDELRLRRIIKKQEETNAILEERTATLASANLNLKQFAYMASHDLRSPLKTIINMADVMMINPEHTASKPLRFVRDSALRLETLVAGYYRLASLQCAPREARLLSELVDTAKNNLDTSITTNVQSDQTVHCDAVLMLQVFTNLIGNAAMYSSDNSITFEAERTPTTVVIRAKNSVANEVSTESILAPFRRMTTTGDGMGLGLAIVDRVAQLHEGSVSVTSTQGEFCVELRIPEESLAA